MEIFLKSSQNRFRLAPFVNHTDTSPWGGQKEERSSFRFARYVAYGHPTVQSLLDSGALICFFSLRCEKRQVFFLPSTFSLLCYTHAIRNKKTIFVLKYKVGGEMVSTGCTRHEKRAEGVCLLVKKAELYKISVNNNYALAA